MTILASVTVTNIVKVREDKAILLCPQLTKSHQIFDVIWVA